MGHMRPLRHVCDLQLGIKVSHFIVVLATKLEWKEAQGEPTSRDAAEVFYMYHGSYIRAGTEQLLFCSSCVCSHADHLPVSWQNGEAGEKLFSTSLQIPGVSVWLVIHATHQRDTQAHEGWISSDSLLSVGLGLEQLHKGELRDGIVWTLSKSD